MSLTAAAPKGFGAAVQALGAAKSNMAKPATAEPDAAPRAATVGVARRPSAMDHGKAFLEENKGKDGVKQLPSGLQIKILRNGDGERCTSIHNR
jgi:FKBP-type peptidyl-prolyl cis-trans isomerase